MNTTTATKTVKKLIAEKVVMGMTITPKIAEDFLNHNTCNRPLIQTTVDDYVQQMKKGKWRLNGEPIIFSKTNVILDGQHRLWAVVESGVTIKCDVRYGIEDDTFPTMNTGRGRQASDVLAISGIENYTHIAAMVKFIINFKNGHIDQATRSYSKGFDKITNEMVREFAEKHNKSLQESRVYGYKNNDKIVKQTQLASLHYIFKKLKDAENDANEFCGRVGDGVSLSKDSPMYVLRKILRADNENKKNKMTSNHRVALICKAWNLYRKGSKSTRLTVDTIKEGFPKPI